MKPIPFNALAKILEKHHPCQSLIKGVAIDSRKVQYGDLFFALPGNRVDGHSFIQEAFDKGAVGAIVKEDFQGDAHGNPLLHVPNVLAALHELARKILARRQSKVIAITGSLGKTTTKEFAARLLGTRYRIFASPLSYNSQITLPLSILMADGTEDFLILEMGMTHDGNIKNLISIAPPDISLITTLAVQHADNFADGIAGISREKAQIFAHPKTELGLLNHDMPHYKEIYATGTCLKKTFSMQNPQADYFLETISEGVRIHAKGEQPYEIALKLPVKVHYQNFLAAAALSRSLDIPWTSIRESAPFLKLPAMRFEKIEKQGIVFINDAYNANPDSMKAALEHLPKPHLGGKVIAVLGDMDALGLYSEEGHAFVAKTALGSVDYILFLGPRWKQVTELKSPNHANYELFETYAALENSLKKLTRAGDVVLLKGARAHTLEQILTNY